MRRATVCLVILAHLLAACAAPDPSPTPEATATPTPNVIPTATPLLAAIGGVVWRDECKTPGEGQPALATPPPGCIATGSAHSLQADGIRESDELGLAGVTVGLGVGPCPANGLTTTLTDANGWYAFTGLPAGTYCVAVNATDVGNSASLLTGVWTQPANLSDARLAGITLALSEGESIVDANFGWAVQLPPTVAPTLYPTATPHACDNRAGFVADVTIPDYTQVPAGSAFTKTWRIRNVGNCDWTPDYALAFVSGDKLNGPEAVPLGVLIPPGATIDVSVNLSAPTNDGLYRGEWQLRGPNGIAVGGGEQGAQTLWVQIVVGNVNVGGTFELGGQVNDFSAPDKMRYAGMAWVKRQVRWSPGAAADAGLITDAHAKGFKILLSVIGASPDAISGGANYDSYAAYVGELARLGADGIEVWNEMNLDREWPVGQINPTSYTSLLRRAYQSIKASNGGTLVISGAPAPTGAEGQFGPDHVWNDDRYLAGMVAAGAGDYLDCLGAHYNEGVVSPTQSSGDPRNPSDYYSRYYSTMVSTYFNAFGGAKRLCFTELGYLTSEGYGPLPPSFAWGANTSVAQQAEWLGQAASLAKNGGKVRLLIVFNMDFTLYGDDPQAGFAIIRPGGACPACEALRMVTGGR